MKRLFVVEGHPARLAEWRAVGFVAAVEMAAALVVN